ncbi:MAG: LacI family DNA-binding transcriptional regulator [Bacteroidota bacterium]
MGKKVSITDIAKKAGVSIASVSYVMNGIEKEKRVSEEVANKIRETAALLNYQPNHIAKSLKQGSTKTIGLVVADISNSFFGDMAKAIEEEASKHAYTVIFGNSNEDFSKSRNLVNTLMSRQVDGLIVTPVQGGESKIQKLSNKMPLVFVDRYIENESINYVILDNYAASYDAVEQLYNKGFRKTAIVGYDSDMMHIQERFRGYREAMKRFNPDVETLVGTVSYQSIEEDIANTLDAMLQQEQAVDSIVFATNTLTIAGLQHLRKRRIKIQEDLSVIGFDGNVAFDFFSFPFTYVKQPVYEMGKKAVEILINKMNGKNDFEQVKFKHEMVDSIPVK